MPINYPEFREHAAAAESANDAIMALFVGSQLAARTLTLTAGSTRSLSEIFPAVPHVTRLALTGAAAIELIDQAEAHLANVAVPHALALHEGYVNSVRNLLVVEGVPVPNLGLKWNAENMHQILFAAMGVPVPDGQDIYDLLRRLRNAIVHNASNLDSYAVATASSLTGASAARWQAVVGSPASNLLAGTRLKMGLGEIMMAFSSARYFTTEINTALGNTLSRAFWARTAVLDYSTTEPSNFAGSMRLGRKLLTHATLQYRALRLTQSEIDAAARAVGVSPTRL